MKLTKYLCHVLTIKDVLDDGIRTLAYFYKDSATSCKEIEKNCDKKDCNKEDRDNWKGSWWLKRTVIIEKDCDNWKGLW